MSKETSVGRAMGKWKPRVREVHAPCWLCLPSGHEGEYVVGDGMCIGIPDYCSSKGPPKELSSQNVAFSKSLGKIREGGREAERMEA